MTFKDDGCVYMTQKEYDDLNDKGLILFSGYQGLVLYQGYTYKIKLEKLNG